MIRLFIIEIENKTVKVKENFKTGSQKSQQGDWNGEKLIR